MHISLISQLSLEKYKKELKNKKKKKSKKGCIDGCELIAGELLTGCDCIKRNGLQDSCRRLACKNVPTKCLKSSHITCPYVLKDRNLMQIIDESKSESIIKKSQSNTLSKVTKLKNTSFASRVKPKQPELYKMYVCVILSKATKDAGEDVRAD